MKTRDRLLDTVRDFLEPYRQKNLYIGLSGGIDSIVLLDLLCALHTSIDFKLCAIHINHQLSPHANEWQTFVERECATRALPLVSRTVTVQPERGEGLEACAREQRYRAFSEVVSPGEYLLTAHHADDRVETMLHHLFRGNGLSGLTAMKPCESRGEYTVLRPLLTIGRSEIETYAKAQDVCWIEDESNQDCALTRNYLRHRVLPVIGTHYPALQQNVLRTQQLLSESEASLDYYIRQDYERCSLASGRGLSVSQLLSLPEQVRPLVLRFWFKQSQIRYPSHAVMQQLLTQVLAARPDAEPSVEWDQIAVRRYRDEIHLLPKHLPELESTELDWDMAKRLQLPADLGTLQTNHACRGQIRIKFAQIGEQIRPRGAGITKKLKHLFQERGIPPWQRKLMPMLYSEQGELLCIPGLVSSQRFFDLFGDDQCIIWEKGQLFTKL